MQHYCNIQHDICCRYFNSFVDDDDLHMHFQVPSRIIQLRGAVRYLAAADPARFEAMREAFECRHLQDFDDHVASRSDDQPSERIVCSENFQDYIRLTVKKYLETNVADVMAHILPAFEAVVRDISLILCETVTLSACTRGDARQHAAARALQDHLRRRRCGYCKMETVEQRRPCT